MSVRDYGWYLAAFVALLIAGACILIAGITFFASLTPMYVSLVFSISAIALAIVAWRRHPRSDAD